MAGSVGAYQVPSNQNAAPPPEAPKLEDIKLIDYDFKKYGSAPTSAPVCCRSGTPK